MPNEYVRSIPVPLPPPATQLFEIDIPGFHLRLEVRGMMSVAYVDKALEYLHQLRKDLAADL